MGRVSRAGTAYAAVCLSLPSLPPWLAAAVFGIGAPGLWRAEGARPAGLSSEAVALDKRGRATSLVARDPINNDDIERVNQAIAEHWERAVAFEKEFHDEFHAKENDRVKMLQPHTPYEVPVFKPPSKGPEPVGKLPDKPPEQPQANPRRQDDGGTTGQEDECGPVVGTDTGQRGDLVRDEELGEVGKSDSVKDASEVNQINSGEEAVVEKELGSSINYGTFSGNHFHVTLRWKGRVDLDLRMIVEGHTWFRTDKVMRVNWAEEKDSVFNLVSDERGDVDCFNTEVITLRDDWVQRVKDKLGFGSPPDGKYWISVQYFSSVPGSVSSVEPPEDKRGEEIQYDATLYLGPEFDSHQDGKEGASVRGKIKWDSNVDRRTKLLFGFDRHDGRIDGLDPSDISEDHWRKPKNGWW